MRSHAPFMALSILVCSSSAMAQTNDAHWIRRGTFPTRNAALSAGIEVQDSTSADIDRDGMADDLLALSSNDDEGQALVLARHDAAGWHLSCVDCGAVGGADSWRQTVILPTGVIAVRSHEGRGDGANNVNELSLYWIAPGASPVQVYQTERGGDVGTIAAQPDGSLVINRNSAPRYQLLTWNAAHTQLTAGHPIRQLPAGATALVSSATPTATSSACTAQPHASFHLRATETATSAGTEFPAGTLVDVLAPSTLTRGSTRMYRVQIAPGGATGFVFLAPTELSANCPH